MFIQVLAVNHGFVLFRGQANFSGDVFCCFSMIARYHHDSDPSFMTFVYRGRDVFTRWINKPSEPDKNKVTKKGIGIYSIFFISKGQCSKSVLSKIIVLGQPCFLFLVAEVPYLSLAENITGVAQHFFRCTLHGRKIFSFIFMNGAHYFCLRVKRIFIDSRKDIIYFFEKTCSMIFSYF